MSTQAQPRAVERGPEPALDLIRKLASGVGPRRPCSRQERAGAQTAVAWLDDHGVRAQIESFEGFASFAQPFGVILGSSFAARLLQQRGKRAGDALALTAFAAASLEGDLRFTPISDLLSRQPSANVVASVPPSDEERARVCVCGHLDTSRSGLMFHPRLVGHLRPLFTIPLASAAAAAAGPVLRRLPGGGAALGLASIGLAYGLVMLAERELRGQEVPGANDNASGSGVAAQLVAECAATPLRHTRVDLLLTGCEEVGMRGAQAYLRSRRDSASNTVFINFDSVGGDAPLRYILKEGMPLGRPASARLIELVERIAARRPDLELLAGEDTAALPTDATVALARGCEAITFLARGETIPNYHWPTDTSENIAPRTVQRALEVGRELLQDLDRGSWSG
jgi:hypothetical protein